jgi:hypothetical protein
MITDNGGAPMDPYPSEPEPSCDRCGDSGTVMERESDNDRSVPVPCECEAGVREIERARVAYREVRL